MLEGIIGLLVLGWLFFKWWTYPYMYWKKRRFPYLEAKSFLGCRKELVLMNKFQGYPLQEMYNEMGDNPYAGFVLVRRPHLLLKDPEIIKAVMLKDFPHFTDRIQVDNISEPLSHHLFNLGGNKWKALRTKMTPTFTSGKLKMMFPLFDSCSKNLEDLLNKMAKNNDEVDVKDVLGRFTTKIVGTCAYGIDIDSLGDESNEFVKIAQNIFCYGFPLKRIAVYFLFFLLPGLENVIKFRLLPAYMETFLRNVVMDTMSYRSKTNTKRNDFIDLLMDIRKEKSIVTEGIGQHSDLAGKTSTIDISDDDLVAQVFVFLAAGFETSSSVTSYCLYEMAENPDIQEKLRKEIQAGQPLSYQSIQDMPYLDMVISETIRKYPTLPLLTRKCTKSYRMPSGEVLEKGMRVYIPVYALHHDPKYFPNPDKFDPERFTQENKSSRPQFTYLPFGEGPRLCIGMRFGQLQTKMGIATILSKYRVEKTPNTVSPLQLIASPLITQIGHSIKLYFKPI